MAVNNLNTPGVGIQPSLIDAKGDLLVGTANDAIDRLGVTGTTGAVLTADAGETTGLKWAAAGSVGGLVHIKTEIYSAVAAVPIDDVFSSTYKNYMIIINNSPSTTATLSFRLRVSGSDNSNNSYQYNLNNFTNVLTNIQTGTKTNFPLTAAATVFPDLTLTVYRPFISTFTRFQQIGVTPNTTLTTGGGVFAENTSFTGFSLLTSTGTISGSIEVYGFKE